MFGFIDIFKTSYTPVDLGPNETGDKQIARSNWLSTAEYRHLIQRLPLRPTSSVLNVACGAGGSAFYLADTVGCEVVGIDIDEKAISAAEGTVGLRGLKKQVSFVWADAARPLSFPDWKFDAVLCVDAMVHLPDRLRALKEWRRVIRPGGYVLYTDPAVVTGLVSREEITDRSLLGPFHLGPPGANERLIQAAGLELDEAIDVTENVARLSKRWREARSRDREELIDREGKESFDRFQRYLAVVHQLSSERRLSRFAYVARKPVPAGFE